MVHGPEAPHPHEPLLQLSLVSPQVPPQLPQLSKLELVLMQEPEQQASEPPQVRPHAPQLPTSLEVLAQEPPQQARPKPQAAPVPQRQVPAEQVSPGAQVGSHGTSVVQVPARQASAAAQVLPQRPQLLVSVETSMQASPQHALPAAQPAPPPHSHIVVTALQVSPSEQAGSHGGMTQEPASQTSPAAQARPQAPQLVASVMMSAQVSPQQI